MRVEIRHGRLEDFDVIVALQQELHQLHLSNRPDQFKIMGDDEAATSLREQLDVPNVKLWVAELSGIVVGFAVAVQHQRDAHLRCPARRWCEVNEIGVAAAHRRAGVGRALLEAVLTDAKASGIDEIELNSWAFNHDAHAAFRSFGFTPKVVRFELKRDAHD